MPRRRAGNPDAVVQVLGIARERAAHLLEASPLLRFALEFFVAPVLSAALLLLAAPSLHSALVFAGTLALQCGFDLGCHYAIRGRSMEASRLWLLAARPFLVAWLLGRGLFSGHVDWRGNDLWMGSRARILTEPPLRNRLRALRESLRNG